MKEDFRVGLGYDIHPLVAGRRLVLGGVEVEHTLGLDGHSDADVLTHAICDAILGALNEGDIGEHFPETEENRGISSLKILEHTAGLMRDKGYEVVNMDCIVMAERPRLSPYRERVARSIAETIGIETGRVSVKATRGERLGPVGEEKAIAAKAVVLLKSIER